MDIRKIASSPSAKNTEPIYSTLCRCRWMPAIALVLQLDPCGALAEDVLDHNLRLDIPANTPLEDALIEWGVQVGATVMINTRTVDHEHTLGLQGTLSARHTLTLLLRDSGPSSTQEGHRVRIVPAGRRSGDSLPSESPKRDTLELATNSR
jgi:hypothetical protein